MLAYPKFVAFVKQVFTLSLRKTRLENLQLLAYGIMRGRSCCTLPLWALCWAGPQPPPGQVLPSRRS